MERVFVQHDFSQPVDRVYAYLSEHEHLEPLFGAKITRIKDGEDGTRNGAGSARSLRVGPLPAFVETVVEAVPNELIRYRITEGGVLRDHQGVMRFSSRPDGGSHLDYEITFRGFLPGVGKLVKVMLDRNIAAGLKKVDANA